MSPSVILWVIPRGMRSPKPPPLPPVKIHLYLPPASERWDRPIPDPMALVLLDDWDINANKRARHSSEMPHLS